MLCLIDCLLSFLRPSRFSIEQNRPSTQSQAADLQRPPDAATSKSRRPHTAGGLGHSPDAGGTAGGHEDSTPYIRNILVKGNGRSTVTSAASRSRGGSTLRRSIHHFLPLQPLDSTDPRTAPLPMQHQQHHPSSSSSRGGKGTAATSMVPWQPELVNVNDNGSVEFGGFGSVDGADGSRGSNQRQQPRHAIRCRYRWWG